MLTALEQELLDELRKLRETSQRELTLMREALQDVLGTGDIRVSASYNDEFSTWWEGSWKRTGQRAQARIEYAKARRRTGVSARRLLEARDRVRRRLERDGVAERFRPSPAQWFRDGGWTDVGAPDRVYDGATTLYDRRQDTNRLRDLERALADTPRSSPLRPGLEESIRILRGRVRPRKETA